MRIARTSSIRLRAIAPSTQTSPPAIRIDSPGRPTTRFTYACEGSAGYWKTAASQRSGARNS